MQTDKEKAREEDGERFSVLSIESVKQHPHSDAPASGGFTPYSSDARKIAAHIYGEMAKLCELGCKIASSPTTQHRDIEMNRHIQLKDVIRGYQTWGSDYINRGFSPFMLSFMFQSLGGSEAGQKIQMERAITAFYSSTLTRVVRNPSRATLPAWILLPDFPVHKHDKISKRAAFQNDGLHVQGWAMLPPNNRLNGRCYADLLMDHHRTRGQLALFEKVHVKPITKTFEVAANYLMKSLARKRTTLDDFIILPSALSEVA